MKPLTYICKSRVWMWQGPSSWHFVTLPKKDAADIKKYQSPIRRGFGAIRVRVTVGETVWETSIFPDKETGSYILPLKFAIRKKEGIKADQLLRFSLELRQN